MAQGKKMTADICIEVNGEIVPYMTIDGDGDVTWLVSEEKQQEYEQAMLKNIGENMSRFYTAHPEYIEKECNHDKRQRTA